MRLNIFVSNKTQLRYLLLIIIAMLAPTVIVGSFLYYFIFTLTANQIGVPEAIAYTLFPVIEKINSMVIMVTIPLFLLLLLWGLILSHRFCGPLKRVERDLDRIIAGDGSVRLNVRKDDDIRGVVEKINKVIDILEKGKK